MAIKVVNSDNLAEHVASKTNGSDLSSAANIEAAAIRAMPAEVIKADGETPVVATGAESVSAAPDPGEQTPTAAKERSGNSVQKRIDELTRQRKEIEEFAETEYEARLQAQRRIDELEKQLKASAPAEETPKETELIEPDPGKYTDQALFNKDLRDYWRKVAAEEARKQIEARDLAVAQEAHRVVLEERANQARVEISDFDTVMEQGKRSGVLYPAHMIAAFEESEVGAKLLYHLIKDDELRKRISAMSPAKALLALGKIEQEYTPKAKGKEPDSVTTNQPVISRAPAPITPLKGEGGSVPSDLSQPMPFHEYKRLKLQERRNRN